MSGRFTLFAPCPRGVEAVLAAELRAFGARDVRAARAGAGFRGDLRTAYRACLWSRTASRVVLRVAQLEAADADELYEGALALPWEEHLSADRTFAVDLTQSGSGVTHTKYGALRVKDAVADRFRERTGARPNVGVGAPDVRVNVSVRGKRATVGIDLAGEALHRRGYREEGVQAAAPLKETLAAAMLALAGWPRIAAEGGALVDPLCGSGTLPIEAAWIAGDVAPGVLRRRWGFEGWLGHDPEVWEALLAEARERREDGRGRLAALAIAGSDRDPGAVALARACAERAGVGDAVRFEVRELAALAPAEGARPGLVIANPPYGERLGDEREARAALGALAERLRAGFAGWRAAVLAGEGMDTGALPLAGAHGSELMNGPLRVTLVVGEVAAAAAAAARGSEKGARPSGAGGGAHAPNAGAEQFANRLRKNARHLGKWARREGVTCYRLYDADLPDYAVAVDLYAGAGPDEGRRWAHVAEYEAPPEIDPDAAAARLDAAVRAVGEVLELAPDAVFVKVRRRQRGSAQYERQDARGVFHEVAEGGCRFLVNLADYLDTGLFLDHRPTRALVRGMAEGARFLNLFGYTGAFSVHAAAGGAIATTTVDLSATYLEWARRNMALNGFGGPEHAFERADALAWLEDAAGSREARGAYDLVVLDPPTFSNSKRMAGDFDVQRDHAGIVEQAALLLAPGGTLAFSNNLRTFRMDFDALAGLEVREITAETIPLDFGRTPRVHNTWLIGARERGTDG